jgi:phage nucleotide-binding protein
MMDRFHFSTAECFDNCPHRFKLRYVDNLDVIPTDDPQNPLLLGTAIHKGMEKDLQTAVHDYLMSYPVIDDRHINEVIKMEHWIPKLKELLPEGFHEVNFRNEVYEGTADLLVPVGKHERMETALCGGSVLCQYEAFDLYDFKYSNNIDHYMESRQLHVYKHYLEKTKGIFIRKMFFVFIPKVMIKQKKTETIEQFRNRLKSELEQKEIIIKEVIFDQSKVDDFHETCMHIGLTQDFKKNRSYLCDWCEYQNYCEKGNDYMLLPSAERRQVGQTTKRKLWIYGGAFSGKTTFVDQAPAPLNLNTDGNIQFVTMQFIPIKDTYEGRQKVLAWKNFKDTIDELEKTAGKNGFKTLVVDLLEDTYESCRLFMYDKLGISHESDDSFRAWDKVRTEFLSTIRKLMNLDYENIILISHEDTSKDITKKTGDKITAIKPNINEKVANKVAGMVDIVARVVVDGDERTLEFKSDEVVFGGGRLKNISTTSIPLVWDDLCKVYDEANQGAVKTPASPVKEETKTDDVAPAEQEQVTEAVPEADKTPDEAPVKTPARSRRTRKER